MAEQKEDLTYRLDNVEAKYPRIDRTYRWSNADSMTVPCEPKEANAAYSLSFLMDKSQADALWKRMREVYTARQKTESSWPNKFAKPFTETDDGRWEHKTVLKGAYGKAATRPPMVVDSVNKKLGEDFKLTSGSTVNLSFVFVPYYMATGVGAGVSLRLRAVQVVDYVPMKESSPFDSVEGGFSAGSTDNVSPFGAKVEKEATADAEEDWEDEAPVKEPKKMQVKKAAPKEEKQELAAVIDDWDD